MASTNKLVDDLLINLKFPYSLLNFLEERGIGIFSLITVIEDQLKQILELFEDENLVPRDAELFVLIEFLKKSEQLNRPKWKHLAANITSSSSTRRFKMAAPVCENRYTHSLGAEQAEVLVLANNRGLSAGLWPRWSTFRNFGQLF
ncbi:hypothetical protein RP20_CCG008655 [Aedes albopictus]|nr:hypothetical protein RP20_CCG008655 [Aedes albopictus]